MRPVYDRGGIVVYRGDAHEVAATLEPGTFSLAVLDGPYGMGKGAWDRMKVADLPAWYAPHLDDVGRLCGPSASLYLWNTAEGWATLHPGILARGWVFRSLITWDKGQAGQAVGWTLAAAWLSQTEVCGFYARGAVEFVLPGPVSDVWRSHHAEWRHERLWSGERRRVFGGGRTSTMPLHPCQKPLAFAERILLASSRPGESVWCPCAGTAREAVAAQRLARRDPAQARRVVSVELDADGRYLPAVLAILGGADGRTAREGQADLFAPDPA